MNVITHQQFHELFVTNPYLPLDRLKVSKDERSFFICVAHAQSKTRELSYNATFVPNSVVWVIKKPIDCRLCYCYEYIRISCVHQGHFCWYFYFVAFLFKLCQQALYSGSESLQWVHFSFPVLFSCISVTYSYRENGLSLFVSDMIRSATQLVYSFPLLLSIQPGLQMQDSSFWKCTLFLLHSEFSSIFFYFVWKTLNYDFSIDL